MCSIVDFSELSYQTHEINNQQKSDKITQPGPQ
jgi:hypothetical protein